MLPLASPRTYTLGARQIGTLPGQNSVWADTGAVSVDYRADPTLYIGKKIAALQALIPDS